MTDLGRIEPVALLPAPYSLAAVVVGQRNLILALSQAPAAVRRFLFALVVTVSWHPGARTCIKRCRASGLNSPMPADRRCSSALGTSWMSRSYRFLVCGATRNGVSGSLSRTTAGIHPVREGAEGHGVRPVQRLRLPALENSWTRNASVYCGSSPVSRRTRPISKPTSGFAD